MMQNGQQKPRELSPDERLGEMERKYGVIQERIQAYDRLIEENKEIKEALGACNSKIGLYEDLRMRQDEKNKALERIVDKNSREGKLFQEIISTNVSGLEHQTDFRLESLAKQMESYRKDVDHLAQLVSLLNDKMQQISEHLIAEVATANGKIDDQKKIAVLHEKRASALNGRLEQLSISVDAISKMDLSAHPVVNEIRSALDDSQRKIAAQMDLHKDWCEAALEKAGKGFASDLQKTKTEILGTPTSNAAVKAEIQKQLEITALDAANSVVKVSNIEQTVRILEKKLENVSLLLKKVQMDKA